MSDLIINRLEGIEYDANGIAIIPGGCPQYGQLINDNFATLSSNKVNVGTPNNYEISGIVSADHSGIGYYTINDQDLVTIQAIIYSQENSNHHLATLPVGFRPKDCPVYLIVAALNDTTYLGSAFVTININGFIYVYSTPATTNNVGLFTSFYSQQGT